MKPKKDQNKSNPKESRRTETVTSKRKMRTRKRNLKKNKSKEVLETLALS